MRAYKIAFVTGGLGLAIGIANGSWFFILISLFVLVGGELDRRNDPSKTFGAALDESLESVGKFLTTAEQWAGGVGEWIESPEAICPYCQRKGPVSWRIRKADGGISGAKATAAVFTAGLSIPYTGLENKQTVREAKCAGCQMLWGLS